MALRPQPEGDHHRGRAAVEGAHRAEDGAETDDVAGGERLVLSRMKPLVAALLLVSVAVPAKAPARQIPCKTRSNAASCSWVHGRLKFYNGTPSLRLWKIGTHHLFGIYSGPGAEKIDPLDNEHPELPPNVTSLLQPFSNVVFADFEVCPLEPEREGEMQAACIEAAKNVVAVKNRR